MVPVINSQIGTQIAIDERIASLEASIRTLEDDIRTLKSIRNRRCSAIASLPEETLIQIFIDLVRPLSTYVPQKWKAHVDPTRVCKHWRKIAMRCPAFWSCPPFAFINGPVECLEEVLARSKDYPLSILMQFRPPTLHAMFNRYQYSDGEAYAAAEHHSSERIELLRAQAYRVRQLHLEGPFSLLQLFQDLITEETPRLESLDVHPITRSPSQSRFSTHCVLKSQTMSRLRHLALDTNMGTPDWSSLSSSSIGVRNLTTLFLISPSHDPPTLFPDSHSHEPPCHLLLDILRASPCLQEVELYGYIASNTTSFSNPDGAFNSGKVHLPYLVSISISDDLSRIIPFLSYLVLPLNSKINLALSTQSREPGHLSLEDQATQTRDLLIYSGLKAPAGPTEIRQYQVISLHVERGNQVELRFFNKDPRNPGPNDLKIAGTHQGRDDTSNLLVLKFNSHDYTAILLEHLDQSFQELRVIYSTPPDSRPDLSDPDSPSVSWRSFFLKNPSIRTITVDGRDLCAVLDGLLLPPSLPKDRTLALGDASMVVESESPDESIPESNCDIPLPYLETLLFGDCVLVTISYRSVKDNYLCLRDIVLMRQQHKRPISWIGFTPSESLSFLEDRLKNNILKMADGESTVVWGYTMPFEYRR